MLTVVVKLKNGRQGLYRSCRTVKIGYACDLLFSHELMFHKINTYDKILCIRATTDGVIDDELPLFVSGDYIFYLEKDIEAMDVI